MKDKLNFKTDYLPIILAIDICLNVERSVYYVKRPKKLDDYFGFHTLFLDVEEHDILTELAQFVDFGLVKEVKASLYQAEGGLERSLVDVYSWNVDNLKRHHIVDFLAPPTDKGKREVIPFELCLPWLTKNELEKHHQNDKYFEYEIKVDLAKIHQWLDFRLDLLQNNRFMHQAYKYERQRELVLNHIAQRLTDFVPKNLWIGQFENIYQLLFPLVVYELHKEKFLEIKEVRIVEDEYSRAVFVVNVLKEQDNKVSKSSFDRALSVLKIDGLEIKIKKESQQYYFLDAVFDDPARLWHFPDLKDVIDGADDKEDWKKWYNVALAIRDKALVASKGEFAGFFITTTKSVQIDPKYL